MIGNPGRFTDDAGTVIWLFPGSELDMHGDGFLIFREFRSVCKIWLNSHGTIYRDRKNHLRLSSLDYLPRKRFTGGDTISRFAFFSLRFFRKIFGRSTAASYVPDFLCFLFSATDLGFFRKIVKEKSRARFIALPVAKSHSKVFDFLKNCGVCVSVGHRCSGGWSCLTSVVVNCDLVFCISRRCFDQAFCGYELEKTLISQRSRISAKPHGKQSEHERALATRAVGEFPSSNNLRLQNLVESQLKITKTESYLNALSAKFSLKKSLFCLSPRTPYILAPSHGLREIAVKSRRECMDSCGIDVLGKFCHYTSTESCTCSVATKRPSRVRARLLRSDRAVCLLGR
ncbi:hypothetical protein F2Q69_00007081 [Brassica cretica]|uniref:Uncharacterized protein n=1 Tax=Brassica cretica TaxID=69181 RepID=A0A8S9NWX5_BRACR|nr:hypothetical protein F2Q69_00007081 [Brassica cretica]